MRKLLWVGDAACASGFAKVTHHVLDVLRHSWDVSVLGLNYLGDPHTYPYPIYPAFSGGDGFGVKRVRMLCEHIKPDVVVFQNDPWNIPKYVAQVPDGIRKVGFLAVDGLNCRGTALRGLDHAIFWTEFGRTEATRGGYDGPSSVVPLGVDRGVFFPRDKIESRRSLGITDPRVLNGFIVGNVNRNQPRKRLDLTVAYFAEWVHEHAINDAFLLLHVAPTGDSGYDLDQLAAYYGVSPRVLLVEPGIRYGVSEDQMARTFSAMDVQLTTTQGEGWGLGTAEGMACGVPQIVPMWAALEEWAAPGSIGVTCRSLSVTPNGINSIGGVPGKRETVDALNLLYQNPIIRRDTASRGMSLISEERFLWPVIGRQFDGVMQTLG